MSKWKKTLAVLKICLVGILGITADSWAAVKGSRDGQPPPAAAQADAPQGTPTREIQEIEVKMDKYKTGSTLTAEERANNARIKREILNGAFDLRELVRLAMDRHWGSLSAGEQANLVALMTDLLETKAIFSKEQTKTQDKAYFVQYGGDAYGEGKSKAHSKTKVVVPKENIKIEIEYRLKKSGDGWRIYDVIVDDASLVENYRYQFDNIITKHGYPELVSRMRKKLNEFRAGQNQPT